MLTINNTIDGAIQDIEIKGNTVQDADNLSDIKSVGELQEDGTYKMSILSCGKNLLNLYNCNFSLSGSDSTLEVISSNCLKVSKNTPNAFFTTMLKLKPNTTYRLSFVKTGTDQSVLGISNSSGSITEQNKTTTLSDGIVKLYARASGVALAGTEIFSNIQLEEGTQSTPYEPYQENKCDILLPCQLEKVGDVSDRLYYDDVEKAWCIEKNVIDYEISGEESIGFYASGDTDDLIGFSVRIKNLTRKSYITISNKFKPNPAPNTSARGIHMGNDGYMYIRVTRSELKTEDIEGFKDFIKGTFVKYQTTQPQFIPLPRDIQIALNSFFGTTHVYMESGEVEGTIKCKIPKSLGATVQSLNNKTDILSDRIEAIEGLKSSQNMKYETDKGYLVCKETKNGVIDDLKIEGKTLVNLVHSKKGGQHNHLVDYNVLHCKEDTVYTVIFNVAFTGESCWCGFLSSDSNSWRGRADRLPQGLNVVKIVTTEGVAPYFRVGASTTVDTVERLIILEGDHTQNPPSYFEGLMSVGQDVDKIEVLSRKEDGNLFDESSLKLPINITNGKSDKTTRFKLKLTSNDFYYYVNSDKGEIRTSSVAFRLFDDQQNMLGSHITTTNRVGDIGYLNLTSKQIDFNKVAYGELFWNTEAPTSEIHQISIFSSLDSYTKDIVSYQSDKKQILFYNENGELEPIQELHEWDSIEKHSDNKWYYHKRSREVVLNGSESWNINNNSTNHMRFSLNVDCKVGILDVISDKFSYVGDSTTKETIFTYRTNGQNHGVLVICIDKSKLSTQDVEGFKQWLQTNNVTVVYQLAQEEVYELAPLHLDSYANETLILCNSGAISPRMEFSITSHINELVKAYGERINLLEEKVYKYMVTQNRMQLASTYSADSVTFKVDYFSLCGDEENYDEDLYNLILNNILVGKDNYDYDKMFTIILDYASWNQISWEQFDILVGLMDIQHNPPVEELPTEDIIEEDIIENEETPVE